MKVLQYVSLFLAFGIFVSCSPLVDGVEEKAGGAGNIVVALGAHEPNRTALPSEEKDGYKDFCDIVLYGSKSGTMAQLASWETYANIANDETAIIVADGSWNFRLTAKRYGVLFSQDLSGVTVRSGTQTKLQFTNMQVDSANTGTNGAIEAKLRINGLDSGPLYTSAKLDDGEESKKEYIGYSGKDSYAYYTYSAEDVAQGNHVVTVFVYKSDNTLLLTIPFCANVIPGYKSTMEEYFSVRTVSNTASGTGRTVTYKANYPSGTADDFVQEYFDGSSILDARGIGFAYNAGGKRFAYWTTDAAGYGTKYYAGDTPQFTADATLYAQWKTFSNVIYCLNPLDSREENKTYSQQYDAQSSIVTIATANFSQEMTGYAFCGWDTKPDGTGTRYAPNEKPTLSGDTMLYAQWCSKYFGDYKIASARDFYALFRAPVSVVDAFSATIYLPSFESFPAMDITLLTRAREFSGKLVGQNATLSGITKPLFTTVTGTVMNVNISSSTIQGAGAIGETCAAGGQISSCSVDSTVSVTGTSSDKFVGGIVGTNNGTVSSCKMNGSASVNKNNVYVGGIVGKNAGTVSSPTVTGATVTASNYAYGAAGVAGYNTGSVTDATVTQSKITGDIYAYVNETAIGLSGTVTTTTKSVLGNTLSGTSNVICTNETATISYSDAKADFYKTFATAMRSGKVCLTVSANKGSASVFLYKGTTQNSTVPNKNTTADSAGALLFSGFDYINNASVTYKEQCDLSSTILDYDYIMRIYNSNTIVGGDITVTYSIELE